MLDLQHEFRSVFPQLIAHAGEQKVASWLKHYLETFNRDDWEPYERLRAFPLYLRNENRLKRVDDAWLVDLALWEWTRFVTLYSPIDEDAERASLASGEYMLNPSAQILRLDWDFLSWPGSGAPIKNKIMAFVCRYKDENKWDLLTREADWSSAAIVDALLEQGRISEQNLVREIEESQGSGHNTSWIEKIHELCGYNLILRSV
jgi:hypothetical protein